MAACGSLRSLFETSLPEKPTLIESLSSWKHHKPTRPAEVSSFAEIFGELYFQEKPESPATNSPVTPPTLDQLPHSNISEFDSKNGQIRENTPVDSFLGFTKARYRCDTKSNVGFSTKNSESLQLCTEGLGSESSDDVDDLLETGDDWRICGKVHGEMGRQSLMYNGVNGYSQNCWDVRSSKTCREFPPPISSIGKSGKPWVCLRSYREDGRFVLKEMRIPTREFLHASREDGRLKLHFVHPDEDITEGEEEEEDDDEEQDENGEQEVNGRGDIEEDKEKISEGHSNQ